MQGVQGRSFCKYEILAETSRKGASPVDREKVF